MAYDSADWKQVNDRLIAMGEKPAEMREMSALEWDDEGYNGAAKAIVKARQTDPYELMLNQLEADARELMIQETGLCDDKDGFMRVMWSGEDMERYGVTEHEYDSALCVVYDRLTADDDMDQDEAAAAAALPSPYVTSLR